MKADELGIDVLDVCQNIFGLEGSLHHDEFTVLCVNPKHDDHKPSCNINITTGYWRCLSCGAKGDILTLGHHVLHKSRAEIRSLLSPNNPTTALAVVQRRLKGFLRPAKHSGGAQVRNDRSWLPGDAQTVMAYRSGPLDYLKRRGFNSTTIERWGVRYVRSATTPGKGPQPIPLHNVIAVPICDEKGHLHSWVYRATDLSPSWLQEVRYLYTLDAINRPWIGIHLHRHGDIVVTEGPLDAMWFDQHGIPAIGIGGNLPSPERLRSLERYRRVVLFCDNDLGGDLAVSKIGQALWDRMPVFVARYPPRSRGTDPQGLSGLDLELGIERARSWQAWRLRRRSLPAS